MEKTNAQALAAQASAHSGSRGSVLEVMRNNDMGTGNPSSYVSAPFVHIFSFSRHRLNCERATEDEVEVD